MADSGSERTKTRDVDDLLADVDDITADDSDATADSTGTADRDGSQRRAARTTDQDGSGLRERVGGLFSLRAFVVALAFTAVGMALGGIVPLPVISDVLGFVGVFVNLSSRSYRGSKLLRRNRRSERGRRRRLVGDRQRHAARDRRPPGTRDRRCDCRNRPGRRSRGSLLRPRSPRRADARAVVGVV